jgi:hypothetical protein
VITRRAAILASLQFEKAALFATAAELGRMRKLAPTPLIRRLADAALKAGPWSVSFHRPDALRIPSATANDYVSQAPYWWPDPKDPGAKWIRRDGETNPNRFDRHRQDIDAMGSAVLALALGQWATGEAKYGARAAEVARVWFLDPKTRMNPHVQFGEVIPGTNEGRGAGIIGTRSLIPVLQGVALLEAEGGFDRAVSEGLRGWCRQYIEWLHTSKHGQAERRTSNNHATWWTAITASQAAFAGDAAVLARCWDHVRGHLLNQIDADGSCPKEEARTRSLDYSAMNLDAFTLLCRLAQLQGVDLWRVANAKGGTVEKAVRYLAPYLAEPAKWKQKQIREFEAGAHWFDGWGAVGLRSGPLYAGYGGIRRSATAWGVWADLVTRANPVS